jgi:hypothetical protein
VKRFIVRIVGAWNALPAKARDLLERGVTAFFIGASAVVTGAGGHVDWRAAVGAGVGAAISLIKNTVKGAVAGSPAENADGVAGK